MHFVLACLIENLLILSEQSVNNFVTNKQKKKKEKKTFNIQHNFSSFQQFIVSLNLKFFFYYFQCSSIISIISSRVLFNYSYHNLFEWIFDFCLWELLFIVDKKKVKIHKKIVLENFKKENSVSVLNAIASKQIILEFTSSLRPKQLVIFTWNRNSPGD